MLGDLYASALSEARAREEQIGISALEAMIAEGAAPLDALTALSPTETVRVIAEVKRSSPAQGDLAQIADSQLLAQQYEAGGASAISVLTEQQYFNGSLQDLAAVRKAVSLPILRKDFIATEYQLLESRAFGADIVLLIVAGLEQPLLQRLYDFAGELGLTALVETHSAEEVSRAVDLGAELIGVNARNLTTFEVDRGLFERVADQIPAGITRVAESAVASLSDVERYREAGADAVLVGAALVQDSDPAQLVASFAAVS
ncbi:indole-3-glycerol phosphate synthase TrpC [Leucobacter sp. OH2974_COT-288]|nr:indole-3-glycerol phosphate synthase TrpC [Leucobacter sp. OH2974_COT-288]